MDLAEQLGPEQILLGLHVKDKWDLIDRLVDALLAGPACRDVPEPIREAVRPAVIAREKLMSTGLGKGYAFPHARIAGFQGFAISMAVLPDGVEYDSIDGVPVRLCCLMVIPEDAPIIAIRAMSLLSALLTDPQAQRCVVEATEPARVHAFLLARAMTLDTPVTARDIMRAPRVTITTECPLKDVTRAMFEAHVESVSVQDDSGRVVGEITCDLLFRKGIPDFFSKLASVAFIRSFDPFEKYFEEEKNSVAGDVMSTDYASVAEDATLMEIVYLLSVRNHAKVYVIRDGKRVGIVDRIGMLNRILTL